MKLPIEDYRRQITELVANNSVVIVTAETGAGKSTQVPRYLLEEGYRVVVTQPRRLAARTVAARVAEEIGEPLGRTIGVRTSQDRCDSPDTRVLFCTDGLALIRELVGSHHETDVLVLDEVHEWNLNMEVLVAWAKHEISQRAGFRLVLMSATVEAHALSAYFDGAPVVEVPGRLFPVETRDGSGNNVVDAISLLRDGRNVLVFEPGKSEIEATIAWIKGYNLDVEILPLHGQLDAAEQAKCFRRYSRPKCVVATNVAQTSVTIDDIDAVVDSGMERRVEVVDGIEGLYLKPVSFADSKQRAGRAGRTKPGIYIDNCPSSPAERSPFPVAEIMRSRLDQVVLRLLHAGFDMEEMEFFHQPQIEEIRRSKVSLAALGCIEGNRVTEIGHQVNRLPLSIQFARMIVEADRRGVVDDVLTAAAVLESGGITERKSEYLWMPHTEDETQSDVLAQLALWRKAKDLRGKDQLSKVGVHAGAFRRAREIRRHLVDALNGMVRFGSTEKREDILLSICAGMVEHLYTGGYGYKGADGVSRELNNESVLSPRPTWLVGMPWDLEIKTRHGNMTKRLIQMATAVDPQWLVTLAPHLMEKTKGSDPYYNSTLDMVVSTMTTTFRGMVISLEEMEEKQDAPSIFAEWMARQCS